MEHYYDKLEGQQWFNYTKLYKDMVEKCEDNSHFVEIGSWKGRSTCFMGVEICNSEKNIIFDCVDTFDGGSLLSIPKDCPDYDHVFDTEDGLYNLFLENINPVKEYINVNRMTSEQASYLFENDSLDFVFIDAEHNYESVMHDMLHWYPKVKVGGYIGGHDYKGIFNGLTTAVGHFFSWNRKNIETIYTTDKYLGNEKCWLVKK